MKWQKGDFLLIPNLLSLLRILLAIPIFFILREPHPHLAAFFITGFFIILSDLYDGLVARKLNQISELGKVLDPLADKIILVSGCLAMYQAGNIPLSLLVILMAKDVLIFAGGTLISLWQGEIVSSKTLGKFATGFLGLGFFLFLILISKSVYPHHTANIFALAYAGGQILISAGIFFVFVSFTTYTLILLDCFDINRKLPWLRPFLYTVAISLSILYTVSVYAPFALQRWLFLSS